MNIYPEIKKIAGLNSSIERLVKKLEDKLETVGLQWERAYLIDGCKEKDGHLFWRGKQVDNHGLVDDDYYCYQISGYCEDDYHGTLYFKTNVPGQYVAVPFDDV